MPLYTYESPNSPVRLSKVSVVVDTSYLIAYSDASHLFHTSVANFHTSSITNRTAFFINVIVRQEFIKHVRKSALVFALTALAGGQPAIEARYQTLLNLNRPLVQADFSKSYERMHKDHVRLDDTYDLLTCLPRDIWQEVQRLETIANMTYFPVSGSVSWHDLGVLIQSTGLSSTDAMIVNYAMAIGADAICTADCDYACVHNLIDVYMPVSEASKCVAYNAAID